MYQVTIKPEEQAGTGLLHPVVVKQEDVSVEEGDVEGSNSQEGGFV